MRDQVSKIGEDGMQFVKGVSRFPPSTPNTNPTKLLTKNPKHRLGTQHDVTELKAHPFFKSIEWDASTLKHVPLPFNPVGRVEL